MWGTIFKVILGAAAIGAASYGIVKIYKKITANQIAEEARRKCKEAFKAKIKAKKQNSVDVGIFDRNNNEIGEMTLQSQEGIDSSLRKGQVIPINY